MFYTFTLNVTEEEGPAGNLCSITNTFGWQKALPHEDYLFTVFCKSLQVYQCQMENRRCQCPSQPNSQPGDEPNGALSPEDESPLLSGATSLISLTQTEELFDLIASSQSRRLDDQRASIGDRMGITIAQNNIGHLCEACSSQELSDEFFNMLIKYQSSRINDQRCSLPPAPDPDEDFFTFIQSVQAKRMDEQRVSFHPDEKEDTNAESTSKPSS